MSLKAYFVSDIHLGSMDQTRAQFFLNWLKSLKNRDQVTHLFLLGDIFDLWIAKHDYFIKTYSDIIEQIDRLKHEGVDILYFEGNHDLYLKHYWEHTLGIKICDVFQYVKLNNWVLRLEHGDQMDPTDKGYRFLRWFLRTPIMKYVAPNFPSSFIVSLGEKASEKSRAYTSQQKTISNAGASNIMARHAEKAYSYQEFDYLVCGHTHYREVQDTRAYKAINLGSWYEQPYQVGFLSDEGFNFVEV